MKDESAQMAIQEKTSARQNRMDMTNEGVKALLAINGTGAASMLTLLQFILQQGTGPRGAAIAALVCFAIGMVVAAGINFFRVESSLAHAGRTQYRRFWFWFHRALAMISAIAFFVGAVIIAVGYACI
jgi:hypothetical protein